MSNKSDKAIVIIEEPDLSHPRERVSSSSVSMVGWDEETKILWVTYSKSNTTYKYIGVPESEYDNVMNASSIGTYIAKNIKTNFMCEGM